MAQDSARIIGMDVGDKHCQVCVLDAVSGSVLREVQVRTTPAGLRRFFACEAEAVVALEVGPHSPWISRLLSALGHEVLVANARQVRLIHAGQRKSDRLDAEKLARLARFDPRLLHPVQHRGVRAHAELACVRSRDALVRARTQLVSHVRGAVKAFGGRIPKCSTQVFPRRAAEALPEELAPALSGVLAVVEELNEAIAAFDRQLEALSQHAYPETAVLRQVNGVGPVTALTFLLTLEDPRRFRRSREVGPYLGLTPGQRQSGGSDPRRRITKEGDKLLRRLLVQCAQNILKTSASPCDLKAFGERLAARGGAYAKTRAVTAVARKLAVLLHRLWSTGEVYEPHHNRGSQGGTPVAA